VISFRALNPILKPLENFLKGLRRDGTMLVVEGAATATGLRLAIRTVTADTTLTADDFTVLVDATGGARTQTPLACADAPGQMLVVGKVDVSANNVVFNPAGADTVDGAATLTWNTPNQTYWFHNDGVSNWKVL
jgi:hypothetical protein